MFRFLKEIMAHRRAMRALDKLISPDVYANIMSGKELPIEKVYSGPLNYILVQVRDDDTDQGMKLIERSWAILAYSGVIEPLTWSLTLVICNAPSFDSDQTERCAEFAAKLHQNIPHDLKIFYGKINGIYGMHGSSQRSQYGPILPSRKKLLEQLDAVDYGTLREVSDV